MRRAPYSAATASPPTEIAPIRAEAAASGHWPPKAGELIVDMRTEILEPLSFAPPLQPVAGSDAITVSAGRSPAVPRRKSLPRPFRL